MTKEATWKAVVLLHKGREKYCIIGLMEVVQKAVTVIINRHLSMAISFHGVLHGFWAGRRTRTDYLKAKMIQNKLWRRSCTQSFWTFKRCKTP